MKTAFVGIPTSSILFRGHHYGTSPKFCTFFKKIFFGSKRRIFPSLSIYIIERTNKREFFPADQNSSNHYQIDENGRLTGEAVNRFVQTSMDLDKGTVTALDTKSGLKLMTYSDSFSGSEINSDRWKAIYWGNTDIEDILGVDTRQNDGLQFSFPRGYCGRIFAQDNRHPIMDDFGCVNKKIKTSLLQRLPLVGDFDISVEFDGVQSEIISGANYSSVSIGLQSSTGGWAFSNEVGPIPRVYFYGNYNGGSASSSGKLRLTRSGNTVQAYRWNESTSSWDTYSGWSQYYANSVDGPLYLMVSCYVHENSSCSGTLRNLVCDIDYVSNGEYESPVYDAGRSVTWDQISWTEDLPTGTDIELQIATSSSESGPWNYVGPDGTSGTKFTTSTGQSVGTSVTGRYFRTKAFLTGDGTVTPTLSEVHVSYSGDVTSQYSAFQYDDAGNMTEKSVVTDASQVIETRTYDDLNQLTANAVDDGSSVVNWTYGYDDNGNLTSRSDGTDTWTYSWDDENRLTSVVENSTTLATYQYDSKSRLLQRVAGGTTTNFTWDGWDLVKEEKTGAITETTRYAVPQSGVQSFVRNGSRYYLHGDGLSSSQLVTDSNGNVAARIIYGAWGDELYASDSVPNGLDARFVGGLGVRNDAATGLVYMRRRWYDPKANRFLSRDPIGFAGGINLYEYASNSPIQVSDPYGLTASERLNEINAAIYKKVMGNEQCRKAVDRLRTFCNSDLDQRTDVPRENVLDAIFNLPNVKWVHDAGEAGAKLRGDTINQPPRASYPYTDAQVKANPALAEFTVPQPNRSTIIITGDIGSVGSPISDALMEIVFHEILHLTQVGHSGGGFGANPRFIEGEAFMIHVARVCLGTSGHHAGTGYPGTDLYWIYNGAGHPALQSAISDFPIK